MKLLNKQTRNSNRKGTTILEVAFMLLWLFPIGIATVEFGHVFMTIHTINAAARNAARAGIGDGATTADVDAVAKTILGKAINADAANLKVLIKDGSQFDDPTFDASTLSDYESLPDADLATIPSHTLFIVRVQVPYSEVGIMGSWWLQDVNLYGQAVMRKE
jgi:Flp pilus assembly protein TadG